MAVFRPAVRPASWPSDRAGGAVALGVRPRTMVAVAIALAAALAMWPSVGWLGRDDGAMERWGGLPWPVAGALIGIVGVAALHYLLAAVTLRTASGRKLSWASTVSAQLAAASANRVVPGGVGGATVTVRFLQRAGSSIGDAVACVVGLGAVGALADFLFVTAVVSLGSLVGLGGGGHELALLGSRGIHAGRHAPWVLVGAAVLLAVGVAVVRARRRPAARPQRAPAASSVRWLLGHPRRLLLALPASAGTTAVFAIGFAFTVHALAGSTPVPSFGALAVLYLVAAAAASALPLPAFLGTTEAALVTGLVVSGVSAHVALTATLLFRLVAYWAPMPIGIYAARRMRALRQL